MRSLQHGLGKRNLLLINFDPGASFNLGAYEAFDNKTSVTENPFVASPAAAPIGNTLDSFTSSVIKNPNTAYSFGNNVSPKPWDNSANAWATSGAFTDKTLICGTDGNFDFSRKSLNVYDQVSERNAIEAAAAKEAAAKNAKLQEGDMPNWLQELFKIFQVIGGSMAGGAVPPGMAAAPSTNNAAATPTTPTTPAPAAG
jgi:hypothetical protein